MRRFCITLFPGIHCVASCGFRHSRSSFEYGENVLPEAANKTSNFAEEIAKWKTRKDINVHTSPANARSQPTRNTAAITAKPRAAKRSRSHAIAITRPVSKEAKKRVHPGTVRRRMRLLNLT